MGRRSKMNKYIGKVVEVYIPDEYKNGELLDIMDRNLLVFKVMTDNGIRDIVVKSNYDNAKITKGKLVEVTVNGDDISIMLYEEGV